MRFSKSDCKFTEKKKIFRQNRFLLYSMNTFARVLRIASTRTFNAARKGNEGQAFVARAFLATRCVFLPTLPRHSYGDGIHPSVRQKSIRYIIWRAPMCSTQTVARAGTTCRRRRGAVRSKTDGLAAVVACGGGIDSTGGARDGHRRIENCARPHQLPASAAVTADRRRAFYVCSSAARACVCITPTIVFIFQPPCALQTRQARRTPNERNRSQKARNIIVIEVYRILCSHLQNEHTVSRI